MAGRGQAALKASNGRVLETLVKDRIGSIEAVEMDGG